MSNFPLDQNSKNETINEISLVALFLADALGRKLFRRWHLAKQPEAFLLLSAQPKMKVLSVIG